MPADKRVAHIFLLHRLANWRIGCARGLSANLHRRKWCKKHDSSPCLKTLGPCCTRRLFKPEDYSIDDLLKWGIERIRDEDLENVYVYQGMKFETFAGDSDSSTGFLRNRWPVKSLQIGSEVVPQLDELKLFEQVCAKKRLNPKSPGPRNSPHAFFRWGARREHKIAEPPNLHAL